MAETLIVLAATVFMLWLIFFALPTFMGHLGGCHPAPVTLYSIERAHEVMQDLGDCDADTCAAKRAAMDVLIAAKHLVPARLR
ncbi:hypothetical protein [Nocardia abscessus]|uniref:hypothetical protein n=1 Tax=Nocardia abscessus TaxID=120957 RepID=UPI002457DE8D|nr:hypothetical protein [Nocardia abscessus]